MESKEVQRGRKINRILEMVERSGGVAFHKIKTLEEKDITFIEMPGTRGETGFVEITVEKFDHIGEVLESIVYTWGELSEETLEEIVEIIEDSNYGITH